MLKAFLQILAVFDGQRDQHLIELFQSGLITEKTALSYASHRSEVKRGLDTIKAARGERTSSIEGLTMEGDEEEGNERWS